MDYRHTGFTLAEILITLGIIGVVAAMTLPTLIGNINKRTVETRLKADYSILQQVMQKAASEDASFAMEIPNTMQGSQNWFESFIQPNMKYGNVCFNTSGCWHNNKTLTLAGGSVYCDKQGIGIGDDIIIVNMQNGSTIIFDGYGKGSIHSYFGVDIETESSIIMFIDTNGKHGPNVIGKDIFAAVFTTEGLVPAGNSMTKEEVDKNCSRTASGANAGYWCLRKVLENGGKIPDEVWVK